MGAAAMVVGLLGGEGQVGAAVRVAPHAVVALAPAEHDGLEPNSLIRVGRVGAATGAIRVEGEEPREVVRLAVGLRAKVAAAATAAAGTSDRRRSHGSGVAAPRSRGTRGTPLVPTPLTSRGPNFVTPAPAISPTSARDRPANLPSVAMDARPTNKVHHTFPLSRKHLNAKVPVQICSQRSDPPQLVR